MNWGETIAVALLAAVLLLGEHYWLPRSIPAAGRYVIGILGLNLPLSVLWWIHGAWPYLVQLWLTTAIGGAAVLGSYLVEHWVELRARLRISEAEAERLRREVNGAQDPE